MSDAGFVVALLAAAIVWFAALWLAIGYIMASVSGWRRLRRHYATGAFEGATTRISGYVGRSRYRGALIVGASSKGLYLNVAAPFRIGAGPLLVPWSEITGPAPASGSAGFVLLEFPRAETRLRLPEGVAKQLLQRKS
jgi:hypothetical protein